jgi:glycosyltransferase involved in cell wall biosynthesis
MSRAALDRAVALLRRDGLRGAALRVALRLRRATRAAEPLDALASARRYDFSAEDVARSRAVQAAHPGPLPIASITWFLPYLDKVYYGGLYTVLRLAAQLAADHGVASTFVAPLAPGEEPAALERVAGAFPALRAARVVALDGPPDGLPPTDACVATYWTTAYTALRFNQTRRKFYMLQDFEPMFHPAGTLYAQAEATYGFGLYALANTVTLRRVYEQDYGGAAVHFTPCVDLGRFRPAVAPPSGPPKVFFYARPDFTRNGFELGAAALRLLKERLGDGVRVVAAGQRWSPRDYGLGAVIESRGVLSLDETAALYRRCAAGLVMMFTRHPSYLPLELMASGCLVVTNRNPANAWLLRDGENCLLAEPSASSIAAALARGLADRELRGRVTAAALAQVRRDHGDWAAELERLYAAMCGPWPPEGPPR